jgi:hypothetical protein
MTEYRFHFDRRIHPGQTLFRIRNVGKAVHDVGVYILAPDLPPLDAQLHGNVRRPIMTLAILPARLPGTRQQFVLNLVAGQRYGLICFLIDKDGVNEALKGMNAEFRPEP